MLKRMVKMAPWALSALPFVALAQEKGILTGDSESVSNIYTALGNTLNIIVAILVALAVIYFLYGLLNFLLKEGEERSKAKSDMLWGIIIIAVMVSVWGLVGVLQNIFGVGSNANVQVPGAVKSVDIY